MSLRGAGAWIAVAAANGAMAVAAGAYAAHGLEARAGSQAVAWAATASQYQMAHALALLAVTAFLQGRSGGRRPFGLARWAFLLGIALFCGSLYALAFGAPRWVSAAAPIGGTTLILGWLAAAVGGIGLGRDAGDRAGDGEAA
jgi:uncharacterized membrane protein YgdD (TMEM256/DUF423 family)